MKLIKTLLPLALTLIFFPCQSQDAKQEKLKPSISDLEIYFEGFIQGDEEDLTFKLNADFKIIKENNIYYAISKTNLFQGAEKIPKWKTQLSPKQLNQINDFIYKLETSPLKLNVMGYHNAFYKADYNGKKWHIKPDKNVLNEFSTDAAISAPDLSFYKDIFSNQIEDYYKNQKKHKLKVDKNLAKKWFYYPNSLDSLRQGSQIKFSSKPGKNQREYWEIGSDFLFKQGSKPSRETSSRIIVEYNAQEGLSEYMYLSIYQVNLLERIDLEPSYSGHTSFYIISLNEKELILQIAY